MVKAARAAIPFPVPAPPLDRGQLIDARQIQAKIGGTHPPSLVWIRENVPGRVKFSHKMVRWYEREFLTWLAQLEERSRGA
jgi:predicted DNA-binding transcriptional regulator AlpA